MATCWLLHVGGSYIKQHTASNSDGVWSRGINDTTTRPALHQIQQYFGPPNKAPDTSRGRTSTMKRYARDTASLGDRHLTGAAESSGGNSPSTGGGRGEGGMRKEPTISPQDAGAVSSAAVPLCARGCRVRCWRKVCGVKEALAGYRIGNRLECDPALPYLVVADAFCVYHKCAAKMITSRRTFHYLELVFSCFSSSAQRLVVPSRMLRLETCRVVISSPLF